MEIEQWFESFGILEIKETDIIIFKTKEKMDNKLLERLNSIIKKTLESFGFKNKILILEELDIGILRGSEDKETKIRNENVNKGD